MKKLLVLTLMSLLFFVCSKAQVSNQELGLIGSILKSEIKVYFAQNIELATHEAEAFWAIYDEYEVNLKPISEQRIKLLKRIIDKGGELTESELDAEILSLNKIVKKRQALRIKYYKIFKKKQGVRVASQFYQIDGYIYTRIAASLNESMPLVVPTKE